MAIEAKHTFDPVRIRAEFPILAKSMNGKPLAYLDSAASAQKPQCVIDSMVDLYTSYYANIHRGVYQLSEMATERYEAVRGKVAKLINARESREVIFVRGTTEAINLVAATYGRKNIGPGDEVLITHMEHHSNIVPWQMLCEEKGAKLVVAPIDDRGELMMDEFEKLLSDRTRIVSVVHQSNSLGTINPVREIVALAHARGIPVLLDGAQTMAHKRVDVQDLGCDFYALSGHKMFGPTGIGVLYGRAEVLEEMPPWQGGGDMIRRVTFEKTTFNDLPYKFEAGTPDIAAGIGLGASIDFLEGLDLSGAAEYEAELLRYAEDNLSELPGVRLIGTARKKSSVVSFVVDGMGALDVGTYLDQQGVAVRTGHHCTQPVMDRFGVSGTVRASLACYNNRDDIDRLVDGVRKVIRIFQG